MAIVGASARPGSFGSRMVAEAAKSPAGPLLYPVNPRYREIDGFRCYPSLEELPGPADLVLLGVPDAALEQELAMAAGLGCRSAVIFGNAHEDPAPPGSPMPSLRQRLAAIARSAGMELCGAGCMGFANVGYGLRAMGYVEPDPLPAGPVALVTHSGSVFSTLLRTRRAFGFTLAVSSGQELVTSAPSYLSYALDQPQTKVLALVLEAMREPDALRDVLAVAVERDIPVVLLTAGTSASGRAMVAAHSGALAGSDGAWEALARAYGIHRVGDLAELADTLELFSLQTGSGRPAGSSGHRLGIATVHDSGLERAHAVDLADELGVPFAPISETTTARLANLLDPGLLPTNPLDVWGVDKGIRELFGAAMLTLASDESVDIVALAVDMVTELDNDVAYQQAVLDVAGQTDKPIAVVSNLASSIDQGTAAALRANGVAVLEGMRPGLLALRHLLGQRARQPGALATPPGDAGSRPADGGRLARARALLAQSCSTGAAQFALLAEYGIESARAERASSVAEALAAAGEIGYPVVLKTDEPRIAHKSDVGGVILGIGNDAQLGAAYGDLSARLGPGVLVCQAVAAGTELALGIVRDPGLGPLVVVGAGGTLVELIADRAVALPPLSAEQALGLLDGLKVRRLLDGARGAPPADLGAIAKVIVGLSELASDLGQHIDALDINPLICGPHGAVAVDVLVIPR
jgi:acyl-CoA synthetase (NDP forming)